MKFFLLLFLIPIFIVNAQIDFPVLKNYANDFSSTLKNSELYTLNSALKKFDDSTSNQIVFLMIRSLDGYSLEMYTYEVASKNKIGSAKNNNGVLFFVAKDDRKMRIEVGYGLEGTLPDALASSILRNEVRPYFKRDDYYAGISSGLNAIMAATKGEYTNDKKDDEKGIGFPIMYIILILLFIIFSGSKGGRGGRGGILPWLILSSMGSGKSRGGWGSRGFGGGGSFGGGFGGFSGGGGSFGGGGASGSW
ncbi:MAG: TPM domain-containing protein [Melioribacteraceae bacterium]|nr:TPM domain-containing protein [Melioribacteraceae bacterium]